MSDLAWEALSDQAIAAAGVLYFVALLAYLVEWAALRSVEREPAAAAATPTAASTSTGAGAARGDVLVAEGPASETPDAPDTSSGDRSRTAELGARLGLVLLAMAAAVHLVGLVARGLAADPNRVPWGNMYEFTASGTFFVTVIFLVLYRRYSLRWLGPIVAGFVLSVLMVAVLWLRAPVSPLREALNSEWLVIHVVAAVIATGAFTVAGMASVLFLVKDRQERRGKPMTGYLARVPSKEKLDLLSYRVHAFAFPVWTFAVLIAGPIWAYEAWASYWNWDPKEVWAFITWVLYAAYLHARATAGWKGRSAAWLALIGMATLWFNFIGINYFSSTSQHSYAAPAVVEAPVVPGGSPGA